jgi:quercetin dioxygenase-like cupin family protein
MVHAAGNTTAAPARLLVTNLVPKGAEQSYPGADARPAPPPPATRTFNGKFEIPAPRQPFRLLEAVLDLPAGTEAPALAAGGTVLHTVLDGQVAVLVDGAAATYAAGQTWAVLAGQREQIGNRGAAPASVYVTALLPSGAPAAAGLPAASPPAAALPRTGAGPGRWFGLPGWRALAGGVALGAALLGYVCTRRARAGLHRRA